MPRALRDVLLYLLALALVVLAVGGVSFWLLRASYAGVTDDGAVQAGVAAYPDYLRSVAKSIAALTVMEIAALFAATSGVAVLLGRRESKGASGFGIAFSRVLGLALLAVVAWLGREAHRHPGLLLGLLSASPLGPPWAAGSRWVWPMLLAGSVVGWVRLAFGSRGLAARSAAFGGVALAAAWTWMFEVRPARSAPASSSAVAGLRPPAVPNILLIGVDSLRPDKIDETRTPALSRLCRESIYFPNALVTLPRTAPSWTALLTSMPPLANGVETMFPSAARAHLANVAMPAHLASLGYRTMVFSEYAGESFGRVELGFEELSVPRVELEQMLGQGLLGRQPAALALAGQLYTASPLLRRALPAPLPELMRGLASFSHPYVLGEDFSRRRGGTSPWFALLFYSQPHFPYTSSSPFYERHTVAGSDPALRFGKDVTRGEVRTDADRAQIDALYRAALAESDDAIGDVIARLDVSGVLEDTIVILTADHGEGLYECPTCVGHGDNLRGMMTLRVPLAIRLPKRRFPGAAPTTVSAYVSQLDVYPTILALLDTPRPPIQEGVPLLRKNGELADLPRERIFFAETGEWLWPTAAVPSPRIDYPPITALASIERDRIVIEERHLPVIRAAKHRAALLPPFKLVYRPAPRGVEWSLYDIDRDPWEEHDIAASQAEMAARLRAALVHSVLRFSHMLPAGDFFLTRPPSPPEEYY